MKKFYSEIEVDSNIQNLWKLISSFENYHNWSPYFLGLRSKEGEITEAGQKVRGYFQSKSTGILMYNAFITQLELYKKIAWKGRMIIPFGVLSEHKIFLEKIDAEKSKLKVEANFQGPLIFLLSTEYFSRLQKGIDDLCKAAKENLEKN